MNYMAEVAALFGLELDEVFETTYLNKTFDCKITSYGIELENDLTTVEFSNGCLDALLRGVSIVNKKPKNMFSFQDDLVKVVRCKNCEHFTKGMAIGMCKRIPDKPIMPMPCTGYCNFGESRSN